ncbi:MAG: putative WhiB family transcriptional regulator [Acidimicrobiales bacterium]|nr:putative WhiB family transcriptional regulator [Acidimicrobiales bacterium]
MHESWMEEARCRDLPPDMFFPHNGTGVVAAAKVCVRCPVQEHCLEHALAHRIADGVWGGCSERQRRRILKARRVPQPE